MLGRFWSQPAGLTPFDAIRRLRPGGALILEDGHLEERTVDRIDVRPRDNYGDRDAYAEFWHVLERATRDRFSSCAATCLALSGGLDSQFVGAALAQSVSRFHAFSYVSTSEPDISETPAIRAFCRQHLDVCWHSVSCDPAASIDGDPSPPLSDDPLVSADPMKQARVRLFRNAHDHGFESVLDGEGGDELFAMSQRLGDFVSRGQWLGLVSYLADQPRRRTLVWRELVVPRLHWTARALWHFREHHRLLPDRPPWMKANFWREEATLEARHQADEWARVDSSITAFSRILAHPFQVGSRSYQWAMGAQEGIEPRSPMLDRAVIEFALELPSKLHWTPNVSKAFLRRAGRERLPTEILDRPKDNRLYQRHRDESIADERLEATLVSLIRSCSYLVDRVEPGIVLDYTRRARSGKGLSWAEAEALYSVLAIAKWMQLIERQYGAIEA